MVMTLDVNSISNEAKAHFTNCAVVRKRFVGRPRKYTIEHLSIAQDYLVNYQLVYGHVIPSIAGLALLLDLDKESVTNWRDETLENGSKAYPQFSRAVRNLTLAQEQALLKGGLNNAFNSSITKLVMSSKHDYADKKEVTATQTIDQRISQGATDLDDRVKQLQDGAIDIEVVPEPVKALEPVQVIEPSKPVALGTLEQLSTDGESLASLSSKELLYALL